MTCLIGGTAANLGNCNVLVMKAKTGPYDNDFAPVYRVTKELACDGKFLDSPVREVYELIVVVDILSGEVPPLVNERLVTAVVSADVLLPLISKSWESEIFSCRWKKWMIAVRILKKGTRLGRVTKMKLNLFWNAVQNISKF